MKLQLGYILRKVKWMDFCEATGTNEWARAEGRMDDDQIITLTEEQITKLGL